jgi:DNA repair protein RecO (recombination protein O)
MGLYRDEGIVLRTHKLGEADRIVCVCTRHHGKVRAVAKGVRKTKSRFGARLEPPTHVQLQLYEGRSELHVIDQAETVDHFREIRDDLDRLTRAVSMLEAADQLGLEGEPNPALFQMLLGALRSLAGHSGPLVLPGFFLKVLALEGFRPVVDRCVECDATDDLVAFDLESGGTRCAVHRVGTAVSPAAVALLGDILDGRLSQALNEPPSDATTEVDHLATRALEHHLERRLRSIAILDRG